jgi:hypothetical protein
MKNLFLIIVIAVSALTFSCEKKSLQNEPTTSEDALWRTPNGYLIPYSESGHWKSYLKENLEQNKAEAKRYISQSCVIENSKCSFECVETRERNTDCIDVSECAPCINCCGNQPR